MGHGREVAVCQQRHILGKILIRCHESQAGQRLIFNNAKVGTTSGGHAPADASTSSASARSSASCPAYFSFARRSFARLPRASAAAACASSCAYSGYTPGNNLSLNSNALHRQEMPCTKRGCQSLLSWHASTAGTTCMLNADLPTATCQLPSGSACNCQQRLNHAGQEPEEKSQQATWALAARRSRSALRAASSSAS